MSVISLVRAQAHRTARLYMYVCIALALLVVTHTPAIGADSEDFSIVATVLAYVIVIATAITLLVTLATASASLV